jgi:Chorismatase FkbO/Hyg5-like, N-terminal
VFSRSPVALCTEFDYRNATMLNTRRPCSAPHTPVRASARSLPKWVSDRFRAIAEPVALTEPTRVGEVTLSATMADDLLLLTAVVTDALALPALMLQRRTAEAYRVILNKLTSDSQWYPVRIWNWIPDINAGMPGGVDRYMVFNAGRFAAYTGHYDQGGGFERSIATATGVGHDGQDLIVQVLAARHPGTPVENPRQIRSYKYSHQFGPLPPCFARATLAPQQQPCLPDLLIGGTASVRGETSMHEGNVKAQCEETLSNLAHLIAEGTRVCGLTKRSTEQVDVSAELRRFDSMRIFFVNSEHAERILDTVWPHVDHLDATRLELVRANICRTELLVEIEGTACFS